MKSASRANTVVDNAGTRIVHHSVSSARFSGVWDTLGTPGVFHTVLELRSWRGGSAVGPVRACVFEVGTGSALVAPRGSGGGGGTVAAGGGDTGSTTRRAGCSPLGTARESVQRQ